MITLLNLKKENNIIKSNYCYANENDCGYFEFDISKGTLIKYVLNNEDRPFFEGSGVLPYTFKVVQACKLLVKYNKFPERYNYLWY